MVRLVLAALCLSAPVRALRADGGMLTNAADVAARPAKISDIFRATPNGTVYDATRHGKALRLEGLVRSVPAPDVNDYVFYLETGAQIVRIDAKSFSPCPAALRTRRSRSPSTAAPRASRTASMRFAPNSEPPTVPKRSPSRSANTCCRRPYRRQLPDQPGRDSPPSTMIVAPVM